MLITSQGYPLKFIQTHRETYVACHKKTYIFKFLATNIKEIYIVRAEKHDNDFFAVKFYAKKHRKSLRKYSVLMNKGDVSNILVTCAKVIPEILDRFPTASFGFIGSRTVDRYSNKIEDYLSNQRYKLYTYHLPQLIGGETFIHKVYPNASACFLINRKNKDAVFYERQVREMILKHYENILNI